MTDDRHADGDALRPLPVSPPREARADLPIAIASGYTADDKRAISVRWMQKPVPLADLSRVLRDLLGAPAPDTSQPYPDPRRGR